MNVLIFTLRKKDIRTMWKKRICILLTVIMVITGIFPAGFNNSIIKVSAEEAQDADAVPDSENTEQPVSGPALSGAASEGNLRLIFTTDIHGQVVNYDYQTGKTLYRQQEMRQAAAIILHLTLATV